MKKISCLILFSFFSVLLFAQEMNEGIDYPEDSTKVKKQRKPFFKKGHDPAKAALLSAALPGAGQIYNKKYWKLPIVYVGLGGLSALVGYSAVEWKGYTNAYKLEVDDDSTTIGSYRGFTGASQLRIKREQFKQILDISAISLGVFYLLNIVDATVDAHLMDFNVTDDISASIRPDFDFRTSNNLSLKSNFQAGVSLKFYIK